VGGDAYLFVLFECCGIFLFDENLTGIPNCLLPNIRIFLVTRDNLLIRLGRNTHPTNQLQEDPIVSTVVKYCTTDVQW